jgi:hypothetical protein
MQSLRIKTFMPDVSVQALNSNLKDDFDSTNALQLHNPEISASFNLLAGSFGAFFDSSINRVK